MVHIPFDAAEIQVGHAEYFAIYLCGDFVAVVCCVAAFRLFGGIADIAESARRSFLKIPLILCQNHGSLASLCVPDTLRRAHRLKAN